MSIEDCTNCGFPCDKVCPVSRATGHEGLRDFLHLHLGEGKQVSWPCTGCHSCDSVCPAPHSPRELVQQAMRGYLRDHENGLIDLKDELLENGRVGTSTVDIDAISHSKCFGTSLELLTAQDLVVVYPGCLVSARFPGLVIKLVKLLDFLGVDLGKVLIDDESCCGSFMQSIDIDTFDVQGESVLSSYKINGKRCLVVTMCGSCTSSLRSTMARNKQAGRWENVSVVHYLDLLGISSARAALVKKLGASSAGFEGEAVLQYPCQAETDVAVRKERIKALYSLLSDLGIKTRRPAGDLGCCGAAIIDTHPDLAIEYGMARYLNIRGDNNGSSLPTVLIGCGNCYRTIVDFQPAMAIERDEIDASPLEAKFLLDIIVDALESENGTIP